MRCLLDNVKDLLVALDRVTEPELMEGGEQIKAYSNADFDCSDNAFMNFLEKLLDKRSLKINRDSLIIDLGCGPGNITERLALKWPNSRVVGVDGSIAMLREAEKRKDEMNFRFSKGTFSYVCMDIFALTENPPNFLLGADLVVSNSFIHHIHEPSKFWLAVKNISSFKTFHFHRDLRRPSTIEEAFLLQKKYLPKVTGVLARDYLSSLRAAYTVKEVMSQIDDMGLDAMFVDELEDRYLEIYGHF